MAMAGITEREYAVARIDELYRMGMISKRQAGDLMEAVNRGEKVNLGEYTNQVQVDPPKPKSYAPSPLLLLEDV